MKEHEKVSPHQLFCLLTINLLGTTLMSMTKIAVSGVGTDGWISILIGAGLAMIYGTLLTGWVRNHPKTKFNGFIGYLFFC